jgi:hypothetical protein
MQRIERLHVVKLMLLDMGLAQRRHAKIDEAGMQLFAAKSAVRLMCGMVDGVRDFRVHR